MAHRPAPVCIVGKYELHPLGACSEDAVAALFAKICNRGNPLLKIKPEEDLLRLGVAFYRKSSPYLGSVACLLDGEPVALLFGWDCADGSAWKETTGPPPSLVAHSLVGHTCWGSWPEPFSLPASKGEVWFGAFGGVSPAHPDALMDVMAMVTYPWMTAVGYRDLFFYDAHLATAVRGVDEHLGRWVVNYEDIETSDPEVRAELAGSKPGFTHSSLVSLSRLVETSRHAGYVENPQAVADRLGIWGSEAYNAAAPPVVALPATAKL